MPTLNYRDYNPYIIEMLDRQTRRRRDESRYNSEDTAKTIREAYGNIAKGIQSGVDNYAKFSDLSHRNAKTEEDIKQSRVKTKAIEAEEALLSEKDTKTGRTRREQIYMNQHGYKGKEQDYLHEPLEEGGTRWQQDYETDRQAKLLDMDQRRALLQKHLGEKDYQDEMLRLRGLEIGGRIADSQADNNRLNRQIYLGEKRKLVEDAGAIFYSAKTPEDLNSAMATARRMGLSPAEIEVAKGLAAEKRKDGGLQPDKKIIADNLAAAIAKKTAIKNQIDAGLKQFQQAKTEDDKVTVGRSLLKVLNSTEGADAIGVEEAQRLGAYLEYKLLNFRGPGSFVGRDLDLFENQVRMKSNEIGDAITKTQQEIDQIYGRPTVPTRNVGGKRKAIRDMTKEELEAELRGE